MTLSKLVFAFGLLVSVVSTASSQVLQVGKGEKVYFESSIRNPDKTTLILLPGIYRGLQQSDGILRLLQKKDINYVSIHFSAHPKTVVEYKKSEATVYDGGKGLTSEMLAHEVETVVTSLQIKKPLIVSLSYSASVVPCLNASQFPLIVETSPIATFDEEDPEGAAFRQSWEQWMGLWPVWGPIWVESSKDYAYRSYWSKEAQERAQGDKKLSLPENLNRLTEGYMAMARAIETYDIREQNFKKTAKRIWILAENEDSHRRQLQLEAIALYNKAHGTKTEPIMIANSGHTIPTDQPEAYADVLGKILKKVDQDGSSEASFELY